MRVAASKVIFSSLALPSPPCLRFAAGDDHPLVVLEVHFLQLPDLALAQAVAGLVFEQEDVVLGGCRAGAAVARVLLPVVDRQHRHGGDLGVRREKGPDVQHGAERDVPEIRRCAVIADDAVGEHGEGVRGVSEIRARPLHADAAAAVRMIHEHEFAPVGVRLFQRRKLPRFGPERLRPGGRLRRLRAGTTRGTMTASQNRMAEACHSSITLLLSPNLSVSTPMRWAIRSSRLLMWAFGFAGRLQSP